jgi:hypothetical protein
MAKPTTHSALERMGFSPVGQRVTPGGSRTGDITTTHYALTRQSVGDGNVVRPITHHVIVDEYGSKPGRYNVHYRVTQNNEPYSGGEFDKLYRHKEHTTGGVSDPIGNAMMHHGVVSRVLDNRKAPPLGKVTPDNVHNLVTDMDSWTPWSGNGRSMNTRTTQPNYGGLYGLSSASEESLDVAIDIMSSKQKSSAVLQHCPECGGTDVDWIEDYARDEKGLHSVPTGQYTGQCNNCYSEFKPGEDHVSFPDDEDPFLKKYRSDSYHREAKIMDDADGDLRP